MPTPHLRLDHVALPARDAEGTLRFYTDVLGLRLIDACSGDDWGGQPWMMMVFAAGDGRSLALSVRRGGEPGAEGASAAEAGADDVRHLAFAVATQDDLEGWRERLRAHGVECRDEDHGAQQSIYFADPNGNVVEITAPASETAMPGNAAALGIVQRWIERGRA